MIALPTIAFCLVVIDYIETGSSEILHIMQSDSENIMTIISFLIEGMIGAVPFDGLFELLIEQGNRIENSNMVLSGLFTFIKGICDKETIVPALSIYAPELFQDVVAATVASLFFFVFSRLNKLLTIFNGFSAQIAFYIVSVLWYYASFCTAKCLMLIIEMHTSPQVIYVTYLLIFLIAFLLHSLLLGFSVERGKSRIPRALFILGLDALFSVFSALVLWLLKSTLYGLFSIFNGTSILILIVVAFSLRALEDIKTLVLKQSTYTIFTIFHAKGKYF